VVVTDTGADLNAYAMASDGAGCCGGSCDSTASDSAPSPQQKSLHDGLASVMRSFDANAYAASVRVYALKQTISPLDSPIPKFSIQPISTENKMKTIQVYDKPMCCSTGVCGPEVDPVLPQFAADLDWLKSQGHIIQRFNLAQQPLAFIENKAIHGILSTEGTEALPVIVIDNEIVSRKVYPSRDTLTSWLNGSPVKQQLPVASANGGCCGTGSC